MNTDNHTFLQVVRLSQGELWHTRDSDLVFSAEGDVQILYSQSLNKFILRLNSFKVLLDKSIHIVSSIVGRHQRQAYILPRGTGFTMIRLADGKTYPALENFETILQNTASFSQKSGLDPTLATFKEVREAGGFANSLLSSVTKALAPTHSDSHPNQKMARSFEQLTDLDSHGTPVVDISSDELASLSKMSELDHAGSESSDLWKSFMGQGSWSGFPKQSGESPMKEGHQRTSDIQQIRGESIEMREINNNDSSQTHKYHPSIDHQEVVGAQDQRLPSYEVHNSKEFLRKNLRKASASIPGAPGSDDEQKEEQTELPEPEHFEDEAFTIGLLTKDLTQASTIGTDKKFPVSNEDAFTDLTHPMRKFSTADRPFLNMDEEPEHAQAEKPKAEPHKGFHGQPILTAKGQPTLKSNIDDQPSPIPNTEKYSEPTQPEKSSFGKASDNGNGRELNSDAQPIKPSNTLGQQNIVRESSQGNETKKHRKAAEPVDKENINAPTAI